MGRVIGLAIIFLTLTITYSLAGGSAGQLIKVMPMIFILCSVIGALSIAFPLKLSFRAFFTAIFGDVSTYKENLKIYSKILNFAGKCSIRFGIIWMLLGLVLVAQNLSDPYKIGAGLAVAIMSPMYGLMLAYAVFYPLAVRLENNIET